GLRTFLDRRPECFWNITEQWLNTGPRQPMVIAAPAGEVVTIDGHPAQHGFEGQYFPDLEIELAANGEGFQEWRVNGRTAGRSPVLRLRVEQPTVVMAIYEGAPT